MTQPTEVKAGLYAKMAAVMAEMSNIPKTGVNQHFSYKFVTADSVADMVRDLLGKHGVAFFASIVGHELVEVGKATDSKTGDIKLKYRWVVDFEFTFADGETGASVTSRWTAEADNADDKGINKCATAAEKYFLLKTFIVSSADEPDSDADGGRKRQQGNAPPPPHQQKPASGNAAPNAPASTERTPPSAGSADVSGIVPAGATVTAIPADTERATPDALYNRASHYFQARKHFDNFWNKHIKALEDRSLADAMTYVANLHWNYDTTTQVALKTLAHDQYEMTPMQVLEALSNANDGHTVSKWRDWQGGNLTTAKAALLAWYLGYSVQAIRDYEKNTGNEISQGIEFEATRIADEYAAKEKVTP